MRHEAIYATHPNVVSIDDTAGAFDANGNAVVLDEALVEAEVARLQQEYENNEYQRQRAVEYPRLEEQLDYIYHYGVDAWKTDVIDPVKNKYPKPE